MVAPTFQKYEIISDVFVSKDKKYVQVRNPKTLNERTVRWYDEAEYMKHWPIVSNETVLDTKSATHRKVLGFGDEGYITIFKGNCDEENEWFKLSPARYARNWGWYFRACDNIPADLPSDVEPIRLDWDKVGNEDGMLKAESAVRRYVESIIYDESAGEWIGTVGDRLDLTVSITNISSLETGYGHTTLYTMKDDRGNCFVWFTTSKKCQWSIGEIHHIRGTVKEQNVYKNMKQNILTRCMEIE